MSDHEMEASMAEGDGKSFELRRNQRRCYMKGCAEPGSYVMVRGFSGTLNPPEITTVSCNYYCERHLPNESKS